MSQVLSRRLEAQSITFLFQPYHQYVCVCWSGCQLQGSSACYSPRRAGRFLVSICPMCLCLFLFLSVGLGTSQSGQIREFWHLVELKRTPGPGDVHFLGDLKHLDGHLRRTWVILTILTTHHSSWLDKASRMNKW